MESENESNLKKIRKTPFLLSRKESNVKKVKKNPVPVSQKLKQNAKTETLKIVYNISHKLYHKQRIQKSFRSFKNKNYIMSNTPSSKLISAK